MFGEALRAPGERRKLFSWELPLYVTMGLATVMLTVGLTSRPPTSATVRSLLFLLVRGAIGLLLSNLGRLTLSLSLCDVGRCRYGRGRKLSPGKKLEKRKASNFWARPWGTPTFVHLASCIFVL